MSPRHHEVIKTHRIRSIICSDFLKTKFSKLSTDVIQNRSKWLLKPCLLGKGEGIKFGKDYPKQTWIDLVNKTAQSNRFILQEYIEQYKFDFTPIGDSRSSYWQMNLIGTLLCLNEKLLGVGIYRAGVQDLISLAKGGFFVFPVLKKFKSLDYDYDEFILPSSSQFRLHSYSFR